MAKCRAVLYGELFGVRGKEDVDESAGHVLVITRFDTEMISSFDNITFCKRPFEKRMTLRH